MTKKLIISLTLALLFLGACGQEKNNAKDKQKDGSEIISQDISVSEFLELYNPQNHVLIDVRTLDEWNDGHLKNAIRIDYYEDGFENEISKLDMDKSYILYCKSGGRSGKTLNMMKEKGFTVVYNIEGGMIQLKEQGVEIVND
jgi:rhodanese-related sulfurtransferase